MAIGKPEQIDRDEFNRHYKKRLKWWAKKQLRLKSKALASSVENKIEYRGYSL